MLRVTDGVPPPSHPQTLPLPVCILPSKVVCMTDINPCNQQTSTSHVLVSVMSESCKLTCMLPETLTVAMRCPNANGSAVVTLAVGVARNCPCGRWAVSDPAADCGQMEQQTEAGSGILPWPDDDQPHNRCE